ncbi:MAG: hypothetical protein WCK29_00390 [archaeon]
MVKKEGDNSFGVLSVTLGILSILTSLLTSLGMVLGILAIIFSYCQIRRNKNSWSKAGLILGILGVVLGLISIILYFTFLKNLIPTVTP